MKDTNKNTEANLDTNFKDEQSLNKPTAANENKEANDNEDANEASAAKHAADNSGTNSALRYTDRNRSTVSRANEATDRNDTNTGGLGVGGGNSSGEIK